MVEVVVPTHVGVDRPEIAGGISGPGCPHACGGGPLESRWPTRVLPLSPRMWGWTAHRPLHAQQAPVVPTHVGVDLHDSTPRLAIEGCPHACGGGPRDANYQPPLWVLSPRMWGWTARFVEIDGRTRRCPHACGGGPRIAWAPYNHESLSPRMWGWTRESVSLTRRGPVVPTHVGVDRSTPTARLACTCCPHACGGGPKRPDRCGVVIPLSPRMWGWTDVEGAGDGIAAVVPTHVGVDRRGPARPVTTPPLSPRMWGWTEALPGGGFDLAGCPHACGGGPVFFQTPASRRGCPHACGGGPYIKLSQTSCSWVVPTHVGVDLGRSDRPRPPFRCPHACGGGPARATCVAATAPVVPTHVGVDRCDSEPRLEIGGLSPRMWGWAVIEANADPP